MALEFFFMLATSCLVWSQPAPSAVTVKDAGNLELRFENLAKKGGTIRLALYSAPGHFMVEEKAALYSFKITKSEKMDVALPDLPYGTYAFAVFQDENENNVLDKNIFGVPTEPYAFSKVPPSKWRLPKFEEVKFDIRQPSHFLTIRLEKW